MEPTWRTKRRIQPESNNRPISLEEDSGPQDDSKNPMINSVILRELFEVIPFNCQEFKNFRLVSKLWLECSLRRWRQEVWIHLRDLSLHGGIPTRSPFIFYRPFLELLSSPNDPHQLVGNLAFRKLKLSSSEETIGDFFEKDAHFAFWSKIGSSLTHLKVLQTNLDSPEVTTRLFFQMTPNLKSLSLEQTNWVWSQDILNRLIRYGVEELSLPVWNDNLKPLASEVQRKLSHFEIRFGDSNTDPLGLSWIYFFLRYPNIKSFKLDNVLRPYTEFTVSSTHDELLRILHSIKVAREHGYPDTLSHLQELQLINSTRKGPDLFRPEIMNLLGHLSFPLTCLSFEVGPSQNVDGFRAVLELFSTTLKRLLVYRPRSSFYAEPYYQRFPYGVDLPHLEELKLIGPIVVNLDFLEHTSSLKTLVLLDGPTRKEVAEGLSSYFDFSLHQRQSLPDDNEGRWKVGTGTNDVIASTNFAIEPMKSLVLSQMEEFIVGDELCDGKQVEILSKLMPGLKKVRTGLGNDGFHVACKNWTELRHLDIQPFDVEEEGMLGMENGRKYVHANVTDLKYLVSLRMGSHSQDQHNGLTNSSIADGLLVAKSLKNVSFSREPKACRKVKKMLAEKFHNATIN